MNASAAPVGTPDRTGLLAELAGLGEYFALADGSGSEWQSLPDLFTDAELNDHVRRTREAMAIPATCRPTEIPIRVAASAFQLGVAARMLSPVIGAALCFDVIPVLDSTTVRWRPSTSHTPTFAVTSLRWMPAQPHVIASSVVALLVDLGSRLAVSTSLSTQITTGNVASAANGAVTVVGMSRPQLIPQGRELVQALVDSEPLSGTGQFVGGQFRRRSCCLYYQTPRSGLCGDCVLTAPATSQSQPES